MQILGGTWQYFSMGVLLALLASIAYANEYGERQVYFENFKAELVLISLKSDV